MREATGALLRTRFAPSLLHVSVMNDPLSLERCDAFDGHGIEIGCGGGGGGGAGMRLVVFRLCFFAVLILGRLFIYFIDCCACPCTLPCLIFLLGLRPFHGIL